MSTYPSYPLEPDRSEMLAMSRHAVESVADFVEGLPDAPSVDVEGIGAIVAGMLEPPPEGPGDFAALVDQLGTAAAKAVEAAGASYLAYIPGGGLYTSALGELMARSYNRYTGVSALAPGLVAMEHGVMRWLCREFDLPTTALGITTTGGSIATLSALVAARHRVLGEQFTDGTIYVTTHTHLCVEKAARIAGFPAARLRTVPTTPDLRMDVAAAASMIEEDRGTGLRPAVLVGTAGTTDTGTVEALHELADLARRESMWFHVDAAYGGFFQLTTRGREQFGGIGRADSIVLDPHKGLFMPYGTGVLLVRDQTTLGTAFAGGGNYLQDLAETDQLPDYANLTPELTRDARGPRLWLPLHLHGIAAFRTALDEKLDLAEQVHAALAADPRIDVPVQPDLTVVTFRLRDADDAANQAWLERINASRRVFLSSTRIDDRYTLRLCVLAHRTHVDRIAEAVDIIGSTAPG